MTVIPVVQNGGESEWRRKVYENRLGHGEVLNDSVGSGLGCSTNI